MRFFQGKEIILIKIQNYIIDISRECYQSRELFISLLLNIVPFSNKHIQD